MRAASLSSLLFAISLSDVVVPSHASFVLPISGRQVVRRETRSKRRPFSSRVSRKRAADADGNFGNATTTVTNVGNNTEYFTNITLGGTQFEVIIDTGSSDLWVSNSFALQTTNTSIPAEISYAGGSAKGHVGLSDLEFVGFTVPNQAYINVETEDVGVDGLLGLGPSPASQVLLAVGNETGAPPMDRIFEQNTSTPNYMTILLSRAEGQSNPTGLLSIGTVIPGYENITNQQKLPGLTDNVQHWQSLMDANGLTLPDGSIYKTTSAESTGVGAADQLHVMFDSGFTYPQVSRDIADAIYGRVPNATFVPFDGQPGVWQIPCNYELSITFKFGGLEFPISPLDMSDYVLPNDTTNCIATFQQIPDELTNPILFGHVDMILGMSFLRNAYILFDYGDFVDGAPQNTAAPYIQLLPTTNASQAHQDFVNTRLGGKDTTSSQPPLVPASQAKHSPNTLIDQVHHDLFAKPWFDALIAGIALVLLIFFCCVGVRLCRKRRSKVAKEEAFVPKIYGNNSYRQLRESNIPLL